MVLMISIQNKDFGLIRKPESDAGTASIPTCYSPQPSGICQDYCDENAYVYGQMGFLDTQPINSFVTIIVFHCTVSEARGESGGFSVEAKSWYSFKF